MTTTSTHLKLPNHPVDKFKRGEEFIIPITPRQYEEIQSLTVWTETVEKWKAILGDSFEHLKAAELRGVKLRVRVLW